MSQVTFESQPDLKISVKQTFNIDTDMEVKAFSKKNMYVPEIDERPEGKTISSWARKKTPSVLRSGKGKEAMVFPENGVNGIRE